MAHQFIYHMHGLTKIYPGNRKVLEDVNLSFYPDAKIGVLGVNGAGKSTLLRIMAGLDKEFAGEAGGAGGAWGRPARGAAARCVTLGTRERDAGRCRAKGSARPLQRACGELFRGDRR